MRIFVCVFLSQDKLASAKSIAWRHALVGTLPLLSSGFVNPQNISTQTDAYIPILICYPAIVYGSTFFPLFFWAICLQSGYYLSLQDSVAQMWSEWGVMMG
jgi:hypothetical protein